MKINLHSKRNAGLTLLGAIVVFAFIILIGYLAIKLLLRMADQIPPISQPPPSAYDTNVVASLSFEDYTKAAAHARAMPAFAFAEEDVSALDVDRFAEQGEITIERSTNLVDWTPAWTVKAMSEFNLADDTNSPVPACFYRAVLKP